MARESPEVVVAPIVENSGAEASSKVKEEHLESELSKKLEITEENEEKEKEGSKADWRKMGSIGAHGVAALHRYKYSGVDHSYLAKYVLQPFLDSFCQSLLPPLDVMASVFTTHQEEGWMACARVEDGLCEG